MIYFPPNILFWLIGAIVPIILGYRGYRNYKKTHLQLSKYFSVIGFLVAASWLCWSLPFILFSDNRVLMLLTVAIGDMCNYLMLIFQVRLFWYLNMQSVNFWLLGVPAVIVSVLGFTFSVLTGISSPYPAIINGEAVYPISTISNFSQVTLIIFALLVGISLALRSSKAKKGKSQFGTIVIGILFIGAATGGILNVLSSNTQTNDSPLILAFYASGMLIFLIAFIVFRIFNLMSKNKS